MESKREIRNRILELRDNMDSFDREYLDGRIIKKVITNTEIQSAEVIMTYISFRSEVDTKTIIKKLLDEGKKIAVPRVDGDDMKFYLLGSMNDCIAGYMGILEPDENCTEYVPNGSEVMLVPGSVFDRRLFRIGYGKGFYDRYLTKYKGITTIGLAYDFQVVDEVPVNTWDKGLNSIITEKEIYRY